jgi:hypothetical protein
MTKNEIDKIVEQMKMGVDLDIAVHSVGLSLSEVYEWLERGKIEESKIAAGMKAERAEAKHLAFWKEIKQARALSIAAVQMTIRGAMTDDWKAAAWWLEKNMPEKYGKQANQFGELSNQMKELEAGE